MRMIDADALHAEISTWPESIMYKDWVQSAIANAPTLTQPNEPLTLEELRESPHGKIKDSTLESICNRANEIASRPPEGEEEEKHVIEITENL